MSQQALTDGVDGGDTELVLPQPLPFLDAKASKNLLFHRPPLPPTTGEAFIAAEEARRQAWSAGKRCLRQTLSWQVLQVVALEKVRTSLQRLTGQVGFFFLAGSQLPEFLWMSSKALSSWPVVSMEVEQVSQTMTLLLLWSDLGQRWDL